MRDSIDQQIAIYQQSKDEQQRSENNKKVKQIKDKQYELDLQEVYDEYTMGKISAMQAIENKKIVYQNHLRYISRLQEQEQTEQNENKKGYSSNNMLNLAMLRSSNDSQNVSQMSPSINNKSALIDSILTNDFQLHKNRQTRYRQEQSNRFTKLQSYPSTDLIYKKFRLALKDDEDEKRKKRFQQEREEDYQQFTKLIKENEDLEVHTDRKLRSEASNIEIANINKKPRQVDMPRVGFFFLDQPVKDGFTFYFHPLMKTKNLILVHLEEERLICQKVLYEMNSNKKSTIKRKRENELKTINKLINGISSGDIKLEKAGSSGILGIKAQIKVEEKIEQSTHEFVFVMDYVRGLEESVEKVRIKYGFFRKGYKVEANRTSNEHFTEVDGNKAFIKELESVTFPDSKNDRYIYFQILLFHAKEKMPESIGWSVHKIHNKENFIQLGQFCIPFYDHLLQVESVMDKYEKSVGPVQLCFSMLALDPDKEESPYKTPEYYKDTNYVLPLIHSEEREQEDLIKKKQVASKKQSFQAYNPQLLYEDAFREKPLPFIPSTTPPGSKPVSRESSDKQSNSSKQKQNQQVLQISQQEFDKYQELLKGYDSKSAELSLYSPKESIIIDKQASKQMQSNTYSYEQSTRLP